MSFPYELHRVPGAQALAKLDELRKGQGVALILGDQDAFERVVENMEMEEDTSVEELLAEAGRIDALAWLKERESDDPELYDVEEGTWPDEPMPNDSLSAHCDVLTGQPYPEVILTVVPAAEAWMAPCYLRTGGWNEMPGPAEQAALFKYWHERYGATVACIADDVIECTVARPPRTKEAAMELARQQYIYCPDIVDQGVESVEALAATLLDASVWYFWWD